MNATPYLDFYRRHDISPVAQDIADWARHCRRRDALYRFLGIPSAFVAGRRIIEFGPGSGHNALFTASLNPARYLLVDGNPRGVAETRANLTARFGADPRLEVVEARFEDFDAPERFDLVLAEGFLPHVADPVALLRRLARFTAPGGVLVITTVSPPSILSENLRRLIRTTLIAPTDEPGRQIAALMPVLGPHLATLKGMSRSHEHWLLDNVIQPVAHAGLLSIPQAVAALADDFDAYGASPSFITDWRWYKAVCEEDRGFNQQVVHCAERYIAALLDHRCEPVPHDEAAGRAITEACRAVWDTMNAIEAQAAAVGTRTAAASVVPILETLAGLVEPIYAETAAAIAEAADYFASRIALDAMTRFPALWGRGQQYLSLIRRVD